ncbi:MAG: hypothetical protein F6K19_17790 [Cyanothece sp. SIO1E1]|nr:hypothetical protein [Cyanothece sp. SIO1E1]
MNGFDINPDRWYCDLFTYDTDGGIDDFDWLSDWQSEYYQDYTITGLEDLQYRVIWCRPSDAGCCIHEINQLKGLSRLPMSGNSSARLFPSS